MKRPTHVPFQATQYPFHLPDQPIPAPPLVPLNQHLMNQRPKPKAEPAGDSLVSPQTASETANAFSRLAKTLQQPARKTSLAGDTTLEQLITELAKPIIKTWLDQNLTSIVEAMVTKEIERISEIS